MPIDVTIGSPAAGAAVVVGSTFRVEGTTSPREQYDNLGNLVNEIPPSGVTFSFDGGASQPATALDADWSRWEATMRPTTEGTHRVVVVARWGPPRADSRDDTVEVNAVATPLELVAPAGPVSTVEFSIGVAASHPNGITGVRARADGWGGSRSPKPLARPWGRGWGSCS